MWFSKKKKKTFHFNFNFSIVKFQSLLINLPKNQRIFFWRSMSCVNLSQIVIVYQISTKCLWIIIYIYVEVPFLYFLEILVFCFCLCFCNFFFLFPIQSFTVLEILISILFWKSSCKVYVIFASKFWIDSNIILFRNFLYLILKIINWLFISFVRFWHCQN